MKYVYIFIILFANEISHKLEYNLCTLTAANLFSRLQPSNKKKERSLIEHKPVAGFAQVSFIPIGVGRLVARNNFISLIAHFTLRTASSALLSIVVLVS